jgi:hypothetical protein
MDGTVKIWLPGSSAGEIINSMPEFKYPEEDTPPAAGGGRHNYRQQVRVLPLHEKPLRCLILKEV